MDVPCGSRREYITFTMLNPFVPLSPSQAHIALYLQLTECCNGGICSETAGLKNLGNEGRPNRLPGHLFVQRGNQEPANCCRGLAPCRNLQASKSSSNSPSHGVSESPCARRTRGSAELLPSEPGLPGVSVAEAPVPSRMEMPQCKGSEAISLHSN